MAIRITEISGTPQSNNVLGFTIDSEADIVDLPTTTKDSKIDKFRGTVAPLSYAATNDGRIFVLGNDGVWREW